MEQNNIKSQLITGMDLKNYSLLAKYSKQIDQIIEKQHTRAWHEWMVYVYLKRFIEEKSINSDKLIYKDNLVNHLFFISKNCESALDQEINNLKDKFESYKSHIKYSYSYDLLVYELDYNVMNKNFVFNVTKIKYDEKADDRMVAAGLSAVESFIESIINNCNKHYTYMSIMALIHLKYFIALFDVANDYVRFLELANIEIMNDLFMQTSIQECENYMFIKGYVQDWKELMEAIAIEKRNDLDEESFNKYVYELRNELAYFIEQNYGDEVDF